MMETTDVVWAGLTILTAGVVGMSGCAQEPDVVPQTRGVLTLTPETKQFFAGNGTPVLRGSYETPNGERITFEAVYTGEVAPKMPQSVVGLPVTRAVFKTSDGTIFATSHVTEVRVEANYGNGISLTDAEYASGEKLAYLKTYAAKYEEHLAGLAMSLACISPIPAGAANLYAAMILPWQLLEHRAEAAVSKLSIEHVLSTQCYGWVTLGVFLRRDRDTFGQLEEQDGRLGHATSSYLLQRESPDNQLEFCHPDDPEHELFCHYGPGDHGWGGDCSYTSNCWSNTGYQNECFGGCGAGCNRCAYAGGGEYQCDSFKGCENHDDCYREDTQSKWSCDRECIHSCGASFCADLALGNCKQQNLSHDCQSKFGNCGTKGYDTGKHTGGGWGSQLGGNGGSSCSCVEVWCQSNCCGSSECNEEA